MPPSARHAGARLEPLLTKLLGLSPKNSELFLYAHRDHAELWVEEHPRHGLLGLAAAGALRHGGSGVHAASPWRAARSV